MLKRRTLINSLARKDGQTTVEYILMLSTVVVVMSAFLTAFHTTIVRWFFSFIGRLITTS